MPHAKERERAGGRERERWERGIRAVNCLANGAHYATRIMSKWLKFNIKLEKAKKKNLICQFE